MKITFEGQTHDFPDDFTDADIQKALGGKGPGTVAAPPTFKQRAASREKAGSIMPFASEAVSTGARAVAPYLPVPTGLQRLLQGDAGDVGKAVVPQTPTDVGALLGTALAPPTRAPALMRILFGAAGGEVGNEIEGGPTGRGLAVGGGGAAAGEVASKVGGKVMRSVPGAKGRIAADDAQRVGGAIGHISPPLAGAQSAEELRTLAAGPGRAALGDAKEEAVRAIEAMLGGQPINVPAAGPAPVPLRDANMQMSQIGARAFSRNPLDRTVNGIDQRQLYGDYVQQIEAALSGTPGAAERWTTAQGEYSTGRTLLKSLLESPRAFTQYSGEPVRLNTQTLQGAIANPRTEALLRQKLGNENFDHLVEAVTRGGRLGERDELVPGPGRMSDTLRMMLSRKGGTPLALAAPVTTLLPNLGSRYAGRAPYTAPTPLQILLDAGGQKAADQAPGRSR